VEREWVFPSSDCGRSILDFQLAADIFQVLAHGSLGDAQHGEARHANAGIRVQNSVNTLGQQRRVVLTTYRHARAVEAEPEHDVFPHRHHPKSTP